MSNSIDKVSLSEKNEDSENDISNDIESAGNNNNSNIINNLEYSSNFEDNKTSTTESLSKNTENPPATDNIL